MCNDGFDFQYFVALVFIPWCNWHNCATCAIPGRIDERWRKFATYATLSTPLMDTLVSLLLSHILNSSSFYLFYLNRFQYILYQILLYYTCLNVRN